MMGYRDGLSDTDRIAELERNVGQMHTGVLLSLLRRIDDLEERVRELEANGAMGKGAGKQPISPRVGGQLAQFGKPVAVVTATNAIRAYENRQRYQDHPRHHTGQ